MLEELTGLGSIGAEVADGQQLYAVGAVTYCKCRTVSVVHL